jgi:hypothetical protein
MTGNNETVRAGEIVKRLIKQMPGASKEQIFAKFCEEIEGDVSLRKAMDWYYYVNHIGH